MSYVNRTALLALLGAGLLLAGCSSSSHKGSAPTTVAQTNEVNDLIATGIHQAQAKQFAQAQVTFHDVLTLDPANQFAWYNLGLIAQTQNDSKTAISDYQQAIKANPRDTSAMYNEAIALEPTDPAQALSLYDKIVSINPNAATAYLRMSFLLSNMGNQKDAAVARNKATTLDPQLRSVSPPATSVSPPTT